jgi:DNA repair exonuclease SbcCD ATPase subunit
MSTTPNVPEPSGGHGFEAAATPRWILIAFLVLLVLIGGIFYAGYGTSKELRAQLDQAKARADLLDTQLDQANERLAELKGQFDVTSERLGLTQQELARARSLAQTIRKEQREADQQLRSQLGEVKENAEAKLGEISGEVSEARGDIAAARRDLEETRNRLQSAIGDMGVQSGLIARNREELEELRRLGERNYFEFDLRRGRDVHNVGPFRVRLKKVDTRRFRYTMDVIVDDKSIEKKDKTLYEPVQFYAGGRGRFPHEIVVFEIAKDRVVGYLSTPKGAATP